jgi:hypothetical protein
VGEVTFGGVMFILNLNFSYKKRDLIKSLFYF